MAVASQTVPVDKRYRISLLLDAYGEFLTTKQHAFMRHYHEEDLSFGEIAKEYGVSRQAIFDSVKHGEESLEKFEKSLRLVATGWLRVLGGELTPDAVADALTAIRDRVASDPQAACAELDAMIERFRPREKEETEAGEEDVLASVPQA